MKRPVTEICALKRCPYLFWELYMKRGDPKKPARRRMCRLAGYMPSYLDSCPLERTGGYA